MDFLLNFFMSNAYADTPGAAAQQAGGMSLFVMIAVFFALMYFTILRPQSKRAKEQQSLISSLSKGDEVVTAGGVLGRITKISENYIGLCLANNVEVFLQKNSIVSLLPKGTLKSLE